LIEWIIASADRPEHNTFDQHKYSDRDICAGKRGDDRMHNGGDSSNRQRNCYYPNNQRYDPLKAQCDRTACGSRIHYDRFDQKQCCYTYPTFNALRFPYRKYTGTVQHDTGRYQQNVGTALYFLRLASVYDSSHTEKADTEEKCRKAQNDPEENIHLLRQYEYQSIGSQKTQDVYR
jgi:hypothetical protein